MTITYSPWSAILSAEVVDNVSEYQNLAPERMDLTIVNPRPYLELGDNSRYKYTHTSVPYEVPISVMGGKPPFMFTLVSAPSGTTITEHAPSWNPKMVTSAVVSIPAGVQGTYQVRVQDQNGSVDTVSVYLEINDAKFVFVDAINGTSPSDPVSGDGSFGKPFKWLSTVWGPDGAASAFKDHIVCLREGDYNAPGTSTSLTYHLLWDSTQPIVHFGFPGEDVNILGDPTAVAGYDSDDNFDDIYWANISFIGGGSWFRLSGMTNRSVWWDLKFTDCDVNRLTDGGYPPSDGSTPGKYDDYGCIVHAAGNHQYTSVVTFHSDEFKSSQRLNQAGILFSCTAMFALDDILHTGGDSGHGSYLKNAVQLGTITSESNWDGGSNKRGVFHTCGFNNDPAGCPLPLPSLASSQNKRQIRYGRYLKTDREDTDGLTLANPADGWGMGITYMDRCVAIAAPGNRVGTGYKTGIVSEARVASCAVYTDLPFHETYDVSSDTYIAPVDGVASELDSEGRLSSLPDLRYIIGWEV